jgi:hypothetical protein
MRPQHLKDMVVAQTAAAGQQLLTRLTDFTNTILSGHVPNVVRPVFCGVSLCALSKKDGGIRPMAVGCIIRRLVDKAACSAVRDRVTERLPPLQLGFGVKQGAEAAEHAARCYVRNLGLGEGLMKIYFANAFNSINRDEVFSSAADHALELLPFIDVCYGQIWAANRSSSRSNRTLRTPVHKSHDLDDPAPNTRLSSVRANTL